MCGGPFRHFMIPLAGLVDAQAKPITIEGKQAAPQYACPQCKSEVLPDFTWCPKCGAALKSHPCAYCGRMVAPEEALCPSCGAPAKPG